MGMNEMASEVNRAVGAELLAARARRRLTRRELADLTGLAVSTIQRFENGERSPDMNQLYALCEALEVPMREFVAMAMQDLERPEN
ncbi:helix-turn-helix domain-containing protein [Nocardia huaxiensis]|uniref:Helix-turn-helix transcriptional regulator n=2 Tax=Nocardia huaxiensis TaxID=2755382 RepID=A0A7D6ZPY6_9NOCA|nr:helix-turn-helix transcriptional regulator [Nocardia huaxiensis]QLY30845.1 helix-turn-helix transcriptional regulator [Nocardia huaxiensis]UFS94349.1 helix-turn-helix domain-containing protein [Nocardia huaxiensis]